jgi:CRP/FNR family transcriptional activator FtrB
MNVPLPASSLGGSIRHVVAGIPWFARIPPRTLDRLAAQAVLHRVPANSILFDHAEPATFAQFLLAGSVELLGVRGHDETLVELLVPVDMVIPAAVLSGRPYLMRARVHEEAQLLLVQADIFRAAMADEPMLCQAVLGCLAAQFRRQVRLNKNVKLRSAEERVGCYIANLLEGAAGPTVVRLPLEKRLIASQLGMTRETFSRSLAGLRRVGVAVHGEELRIADAAAVRAAFPLDPLIDGPEPPEAFAP